MAKFEQVDYTDFITDYSVKDGVIATETILNLSPLRLKKELNNVYNILNLINGNDILSWRNIESYIIGEICQNSLIDDVVYRAKRNNLNKRPDLYSDDWEVVTASDYTHLADFSNYLAKNNTDAYIPVDPYNPATKIYVDGSLSEYLKTTETAANSLKLNGEVIQNTLSTSTTAPASVNMVKQVDDKINLKLDVTEFSSNNILTKLKLVDGSGSGLDSDLFDGQDSTHYMIIDTTVDLNNLKRAGTYLANAGLLGAPNNTSTFVVLVLGLGTLTSQIATDVNANKMYFRCFSTVWSTWKEFTSNEGSISTALKWESPITLTLNGDVFGSVSFDGSEDVAMNISVSDDSHLHDGRYYTQTQGNARYLGIADTASNSDLFGGLSTSFFIRSDIDQVNSGNYIWDGANTFNNPTEFKSDLTIQGNLIVNGTTTTIHSTELSVDDKVIEIGKIITPTDITANGGGIILKGTTDKSIIWENTTGTWNFSHGITAPSFIGTATLATNADNADLLDNLNSTQFLRSDIDNDKLSKLRIFTNVGSSSIYNTGQLELVNDDAGDISIGFHRAGLTACQLRHEGNGLILSGNSRTALADLTITGVYYGDSMSLVNGDLGEIYTCKIKLPIGTVVTIPEDESFQVDICKANEAIFGVVSSKPGLTLNKDEKGVIIALTGKTPVRIIGPIKKGQPITVFDNGLAKGCDYNIPYHLIIGKSLETNFNENEKLVTCTVTAK